MVLVCVPFMLLVFLLQTRMFTLLLGEAAALASRLVSLPLAWIARLRERDENQPSDNWSTAPTAPPMGRKRRLVAMENRGRGRWPWNRWMGTSEDRDGTKV